MNLFAGFVTLAILLVGLLWYTPLIRREVVNPAPATWILGTSGMLSAFLFYWSTAEGTWYEKLLGNVMLLGAGAEILIVCGVLLWTLWRRRKLKVAFDPLQRVCMALLVLTFVFWILNRDQGDIAFWIAQTLLVIAHSATIGKALARKRNFDSLGHWSAILAGSLTGAIPAFQMHNVYGMGNSIRAVVMTTITFSLLVYYDRKNGWEQWKKELNAFGLEPRRG